MTSPRLIRNNGLVLAFAVLLSACAGTTPSRPSEETAATTSKSEATTTAAPAAPLSPRILSDYMMAVNAYKAGDIKTAEPLFFAMTKAYPELPGPHANLGMVHLKKGESDKAEAAFNQALTLKADQPEVHNQLAILYRNKGQFDKALQSYQTGLKLAPDNPNLLLNLGILYDLYLNQPQEALKQWQHYKSLVSDDKQVDTWIADINQRTKSK
jgi:Tfp pilus assembly protein PilF